MQGPRSRDEKAHVVPITGSSGSRWQDPYLERLQANFRKLLALPAKTQVGILKVCREEEIAWNGDDPDVFRRIVRETRKARSMDRAEYVKQARAEFKRRAG